MRWLVPAEVVCHSEQCVSVTLCWSQHSAAVKSASSESSANNLTTSSTTTKIITIQNTPLSLVQIHAKDYAPVQIHSHKKYTFHVNHNKGVRKTGILAHFN